MKRQSVSIRLLSIGCATLAACAVFTEDQRKHAAADGGGPSSAVDGSAQGADGSSLPDSGAVDSGASGEACSMTVSPESSYGSCGGPGGGTSAGEHESEPNDPSPQAITRGTPICGSLSGSDRDAFSFTVQQGDCFVVTVQAQTADITIQGAGLNVVNSGNQTFPLQAPAAGTVTIGLALSGGGPESYAVVVR